MTGVTAVPASFGQERLWFFDQLAPGSPLYNVHAGHELRGPLDAAALGRALNLVVARHEVLRTTMRSVGGVPRQVIAPRLAVPTPVTDLRHVPAADRAAWTQRLAAEQAALPFDLATGPLLRSGLLCFADDEHAWLLTLHHAVCDAWSMGVLLRECSAAYRAIVTAGAGGVPVDAVAEPLPLQYADFAVWQRELVDGPRWRRDLEYWTRHLSGAPALLELPADRPRPAAQSFRGRLTELVLPASSRDALAAFARAERTTLFAALLAAFQVTLARWTGTTDVVVGTATAGRDRVELDGLIGLFANTLALRGTVDGRRGFRDLLRHTSEVVRDGQTHGGLPFERVVEALAPQRQPSVNPVFQVMLDVQPGGPSALDLPGVAATPLRVRDRRVSLFDLSVSVSDEPTGLRLVCEYATDLFEEATARRLLRSLATVLDAAVATPDRPVCELPLLAGQDRAAALATATGDLAEGAGPADGGVVGLVRRWVRERPDATALVDVASGERVSYADLGLRVSALAAELRAMGVGRGSLVGLFVDRSPTAVVAVLAVLEAGGAYLPLDPGYPAERLATMIADAHPHTVLATEALAPGLPPGTTPTLVPALTPSSPALARPGSPIGATSDAGGLDGEVDGEDLAYVMFTSGSTGRPKGVMVRHGALANYAAADRAAYGLTPEDRVLQFSPLSFDVSAEEVFPCLTAGATLVLRDDRMLDSPEDFLRACERHGVTVAHLPSAYFHELAPAAAHAGGSLRAVAIGGEAANPARVAQWQRLAPHARLVNVYGPTETTIVTTMAPLPGPTDAGGDSGTGGTGGAGGSVPIGRPIPGSRVYVLDAELEPVPSGVVGEILVGGAGLARGYLGDPATTAARFVPDPHGPPGSRLYRTGDRARVLACGSIDFQGRTDGQLKIRGYRVEAGEVEAALTHLDGVREAAVVARTGAGGHAELVAYVVPTAPAGRAPSTPADRTPGGPAAGGSLDAARVRGALATRLPAFMVPAVVVVLEALPRTANDKVDRAALPDPVMTVTGMFVEPRGEVENLVAGVWCEVLKVDRVGADDNFFAIGGHSLLAIQVVSRLRRTYGPQVGVRQLFEYPTLGAFAAALPPPTDLRPPPPGDTTHAGPQGTAGRPAAAATAHAGRAGTAGAPDRAAPAATAVPVLRATSVDAGLAHLPAGAADLLRELDPR